MPFRELVSSFGHWFKSSSADVTTTGRDAEAELRNQQAEQRRRLRLSDRAGAERIMAEEQQRLLQLIRRAPADARAKIQGDLSRALVSEPFPVETPRGRLSFVVLGEMSARRGANLLTKQPGTIAWIDRFAPDSVFWDIGANVGAYTLYAALRPDLRILAFEPAAVNYFLLAANCERNGFRHVDCLPLGLGGDRGLGHLTLSQFAPARSFSFERDHGKPFSFPQAALMLSMDRLVEEFGCPCPNYVKIDVPALTEAIVGGAARTLARPELRELHVEIDDSAEGDVRIVAALARAGFEIAARAVRGAIADVTFARLGSGRS